MDRAAKVKVINQSTGDPKARAKLMAMIDDTEVALPAAPAVVVETVEAPKKKVAKKRKKRSKR